VFDIKDTFTNGKFPLKSCDKVMAQKMCITILNSNFIYNVLRMSPFLVWTAFFN